MGEANEYQVGSNPSKANEYQVGSNPSKANEYQVGGSHYKSMRVEPWDVIDGCFTKEQAKGYYRGNVIKYVMRAGKKGSEIEDLKKAAHYLQKLIEVLSETGGD